MNVHYCPMSVSGEAPRTGLRGFWSRYAVEISANLAVILIVPLIARWLWSRFPEAISQFGFGELVSMLAGNGGWTDIGWEVASAVGLLRPEYFAYDSLEVLHPLIGMELEFVDLSAHSHPPMSIPLGLPLTVFDYGTWLAYWVIAAVLMLAVSMRLLNVPAHIAYPLALVISLSVPGKWGLVSTYPLSALLVSLAWYNRDRWLPAGVSYGIFGATRGVGLLLLLYPLVRKQWRTVIVAVGVVLALLLIALAFEPSVLTDWLTKSRASIEVNMQRADLLSPGSILRRYGYAEFLAWIAALAIAAFAWWRGRNLFWILNWFILAISPIAWFHTIILGVPFLVMVWKSGRLGQSLVLIVAAGAVSQAVNPFTTLVFSIDWILFIAAGAVALLFCPMGQTKTRQ